MFHLHNHRGFSSCNRPRLPTTLKLFHCLSPCLLPILLIFLSTFSKKTHSEKGNLTHPCWMFPFPITRRRVWAALGRTHRCCLFSMWDTRRSFGPHKANCLSTERRHHLARACFRSELMFPCPHADRMIANCYFYHN